MSGDRSVKILYDEQAIASRTQALANEIAAVKPKDLLVVAILKGSFMFAADLLRALHRAGLEPQVEFFHLSSYLEGTVSSGAVKILRDIEFSVRDRDVLLVDDILEIGPHAGVRQRPACRPWSPTRAHLHDAGEAGQAGGGDRCGFRRLCLPRRLCCRLRHGRRPFLPRVAIHRPRDHRPGRGLVSYDCSGTSRV